MHGRTIIAGLVGASLAVSTLTANAALAAPNPIKATSASVAAAAGGGDGGQARQCATAKLWVEGTGPADGKRLKVDVGPNLSGKKSWRVVLQQKRGSKWRTVNKTRTKGKQEIRTWNKPSGTYRVRVLSAHGLCATTSNSVKMRLPKAVGSVSADDKTVKVDVNPDIGNKAWKVRLERKSGSAWKRVAVKKTRGASEIVKFSVASGTYRAKVLRRYGYDTAVIGRVVVAATKTSSTAGMTSLEYEIFQLTNQARSVGRTCGNYGYFGPAPALKPHSLLVRSARAHSKDMAERDYFAHQNPEGHEPWDRVSAVGYSWSRVGENIAAGYTSAEAVVDGWVTSPGHCQVLMTKEYTEMGVGHHAHSGSKYKNYYTKNFATPR